jgi:hypothetical protein
MKLSISQKIKNILPMKKIIYILIVVSFFSCLKEDRFPYSDKNSILTFTIKGQAGSTTINSDSLLITIPFPESSDLSNLTPAGVSINNLASISPDTTLAQDFTQPVIYSVTAENGNVANWMVRVVEQGSNPQLSNSNFDLWYSAGSYQQPGESASSTIWDTANKALAIVGSTNTVPVLNSGTDYYASMTTIAAPAFVRIAAGTIYTGVFTNGVPSITDPRSNITFGTPYAGNPVSFSTDYQYTPGSSYEDGDGNGLDGNDSCDVYVLLQLVDESDPENVQRVATAWFRSGDTVSDWTTITTDFIYGELPAGSPSYMQVIAPETWAPAGSSANQITVVYTSSALGDTFTGAIGSILNANNFVLNY